VAFWEAVRAGIAVRPASVVAGVSRETGRRWFRQAGGVIGNAPCPPSGNRLSLVDREEISRSLIAGYSFRRIACELDRSPSTISREVGNNGGRQVYRAIAADHAAHQRARRPKAAKLAVDTELRDWVQAGLERGWSPEQISARLRQDFLDRLEMRVSHETIYQALYVQGRGALRRELTTCLRTGRALRKPHRHPGQRQPRGPGRLADMVNISERPPEVADRAVPGHWEGDLILGRNNRSAIGTLVERSTRFCLLLHLPQAHDAIAVRDQMIAAIGSMDTQLRRSVTWDQGKEMARHTEISLAADIDIYFADPHSPWQRGTNENTNGLLRQYFPKGTDLSVHTAEDLNHVAALLNGRPRKTLGWMNPAESLTRVLSGQTPVATTT
jgi:IS30 family transposase